MDAICIHQDDLEERGRQVRRMAQIYSLTSRVNVWLGPEGNDSSYALDIVCELGTMADDEGFLQGSIKLQDIRVDERNTIRYSIRSFLAVHHLLDREWFRRLWVRQELHLGREAAIISCGYASQPWLRLGTGIRVLDFNDYTYPVSCESESIIFRTNKPRARHIVELGEIGAIRELLEMARDAECSDPRDKVFAILGMVGPSEQKVTDGVVPDYTLSAEDIFADLFENISNHHQNLWLLRYCDSARDGDYNPTWSPDWSTSSSTLEHDEQYADAQSAMSIRRIDPLRLRCEGCVAAIIKMSKSTTISKTDSGYSSWKAFQNHLGTVKFDEEMTHIASHDLLNAYSDLITQGVYAETLIPPDRRDQCSLEDARALVKSVATGESTVVTKELRSFGVFQAIMAAALPGRAWITTDTGHIGLAPSSVQPGDSVCILLGCGTPIALTPGSGGGRRVLGSCYIHGLSQGETLLGPMPADMKLVRREIPTNSDGGFKIHTRKSCPNWIHGLTGKSSK